ncbi:Protein SCO1 1, mitochondrial [Glycine max]|nr:Protein SCO1 1, mitochondrial [Glycine max]
MAYIVSSKVNQFRYSTRLLFSHLLRHGRPSTLLPPFSSHLQPLHHPHQYRIYSATYLGFMGIRTNTEAVKQGPSTGKAAIGGPFRVINHHGKHVTEKDFMGKWTLLYFGFTHCPDICLEELQKLAAAVDKIKEKAGIETVPVFISIDPERDIVEQVGEYVKEFHPKLIGLTGSPDEVKNVARAYRVY